MALYSRQFYYDGHLYFSHSPKEAEQTADDMADAVPELDGEMDGMEYAMENIAYAVMYIEDFMALVSDMMFGEFTATYWHTVNDMFVLDSSRYCKTCLWLKELMHHGN